VNIRPRVLGRAPIRPWTRRRAITGAALLAVASGLVGIPRYGAPAALARADGRALAVLVDDGLAGRPWASARTDERRADVILLVRWERACDTVHITSVPRDLVLDASGEPAAVLYGLVGRRGVTAAIEDRLGVDVFATTILDVAEVAALTAALGPVTVDLPVAGRDTRTGFMAGRGPVALDAETAVAYLRSRTWEQWRDGRWTLASTSDAGRTARLHAYLTAAIDAFHQADRLDRLVVALTAIRRGALDVDDPIAAAGFVLGAGAVEHAVFDTVATRPERTDAERRSPFAPAHAGAQHRLVLAGGDSPLPGAVCQGDGAG
jgi:hypothetical protein